MKTKNIRIPSAPLALILTFLVASLFGAGCGGGGDNNNPDNGVRQDNGTEDQGTDEDGGVDGGVDAGCFTGEPDTENELLNACPLTGCAPFDNETRLPLLGDNGELPPLTP